MFNFFTMLYFILTSLFFPNLSNTKPWSDEETARLISEYSSGNTRPNRLVEVFQGGPSSQ